MPRLLDYPAQVAELEKMARLAPPRAVQRARPVLGRADAGATCLVCGARPARACAACGGVSYCGAEHQEVDARWHDAVCADLRAFAEDASLAASLPPEALVAELLARTRHASDVRALAGWDDYLGGEPVAVRRRRMTDLATRPLSLARALAALEVPSRVARAGVLSVHVMAAARREREVAPALWAELERFFPGLRLDLVLVGPDLEAPVRGSPRCVPGLYRRALWGEVGRPDLVIGYDCGLMMYPTWKATILDLRGSGVPFVITSYRSWEAAAEARLLAAVGATCLLEPAPNPFASLAGKRSSTIANDVAHDNAFISAWR